MIIVLASLAACSKPSMAEAIAALQARAEQKIDRVQVQHLLIAFQGSSSKKQTRGKDVAEKLAENLWRAAIDGADFDKLVKENTDDSHPGIYTMVQGDTKPGPGEFARSGMVAAFGDVGFRLEVGEIGVAPYDPAKSRFGWHIIKRLK